MHDTDHPAEAAAAFDAELRALLTDTALAYQPPDDGPARILTAAGGAHAGSDSGTGTDVGRAGDGSVCPRPGRRMVVLAAVLVVLLAGVSVAFNQRRTTSPAVTGSGSISAESAAAGSRGSTDAELAPPQRKSGGGAAPAAGVVQGPAQALPGTAPATATAGPAPGLDPKIVKTGTVELQVPKGTVSGTFDRLTALAAGNGGFVAEEKTAEANGVPNGTITLRVPAVSFEAVLAQARKLGKVQSASTGGQDVTAEYTDLDARLKALTSERDQLSLVLTSAQNVGDILAVRDRINGVQTEIEQLQGRKNVLDNQVSLATLNVSVREPGSDRAVPVPAGERTGFDRAWHDALHGFNGGVQALIAGSGRALLVLLCGALVLLAARVAWHSARRRAI